MRRAAALALVLVIAGCSDAAFSLDAVDPAAVSSLDATPVTIRGRGFHGVVQTSIDDTRGADVDARFVVRVGDQALDGVQRVDDQTLVATVPAAMAPGLYDVTVVAPDNDSATLPGALRVQSPPALTATATLMPASIAAGQELDFVVAVTNGGDAPALGVTPATPTATGAAAVTLLALPGGADIAGGATVPFAIHYRADSAGALTLATVVSGEDAGGRVYTSNQATASTVVSTAPVLSASATVTPNPVSVGQSFTLTLTVANAGQSTATAVLPTDPVPSGSGAATKTAGPTARDVAPGAQATFSWSYTATGVGALSWTIDAAGSDPAGKPVAIPTTSAGPLTIEAPMLAATMAATPATVSTGQAITVTMTVTNNGSVTAKSVMPTVPTLSGGGGATLQTAPSSAPDLAPGASAMFTWTYTATVAGIVRFTSGAQGRDANSGATVASAAATSNDVTVQAAAALAATVAVAPSQASVGQTLQVDVTVHNGGGATALGVATTTPQLSGPGLASLVSSPSAQDVPGGASRTFSWIFKASGAGTTTFSSSASGSDANSGATVSAPTATSSTVTIQTPPSLTLTVSATPSPVLEGALIAVTVNVTNAGQATAQATTPTLTTSGSGTATLVSGPSPAQADIAGGAMQAFTWQYRAANPGTVTFTAGAAGSDANSGATVSAPSGQASVTVNKHAALSAAFTVPAAVGAGASFNVTMTVTNSGGNAAINIAPTTLTLGGTATAMLTSGPTPASNAGPIAPGATAAFQWTYSAGSGAGTLTFTGGAGGQDATDATAVNAAPVTSSAVAVGNPAALAATLAIPAKLTRGAPFTVTMTVSNTGGNAANAVTPGALTIGGTATATKLSGPTPPSATIAAGGNVSFTWSYTTTTNGTLQLSGSVSGSDAVTMQPVSASATSNTATVSDVELLANDPFGDGTAFSFVFAYNGLVYLGPRGNGTGVVRMNPDGSAPQSASFTIGKDNIGNSMANNSPPPYSSLGYSGCSPNTPACGPDNENGRGLFASGVIAGTPWLVAGGSRSAGGFGYVYMTTSTATTLPLSWVDVSGQIEGSTRALTAVHVFNGHVYLGMSNTGGQRPDLVRLETLPAPPGLNATASDVTNLRADQMNNVQSGTLTMIDTIDDFGGKLYFGNDGAWYRSTVASPNPYNASPGDWTQVTPTSFDYPARTSLSTTKAADYEPSDRAVPQFAAFNGRYYAARNTTSGPQLWMCNPTLTGSAGDCDPADWTLIARNTIGDTRLSQFGDGNNVSVTLLVATSSHLYVGYNNAATGSELWRSTVAQPTQPGDFEGQNGCSAALHATSCPPLGGNGWGDATNNTRIFSGIATTFAGRDDVYLVTGNGSGAVRVVRVAE